MKQRVGQVNSNVRTQVAASQKVGFVTVIMIVEICLMNRTAVVLLPVSVFFNDNYLLP